MLCLADVSSSQMSVLDRAVVLLQMIANSQAVMSTQGLVRTYGLLIFTILLRLSAAIAWLVGQAAIYVFVHFDGYDAICLSFQST